MLREMFLQNLVTHSNNTSPVQETDQVTCFTKFSVVQLVYFIVIFIVGIFFNAVSIYIFCSKHFSRTSELFLFAYSLIDFLFCSIYVPLRIVVVLFRIYNVSSFKSVPQFISACLSVERVVFNTFFLAFIGLLISALCDNFMKPHIIQSERFALFNYFFVYVFAIVLNAVMVSLGDHYLELNHGWRFAAFVVFTVSALLNTYLFKSCALPATQESNLRANTTHREPQMHPEVPLPNTDTLQSIAPQPEQTTDAAAAAADDVISRSMLSLSDSIVSRPDPHMLSHDSSVEQLAPQLGGLPYCDSALSEILSNISTSQSPNLSPERFPIRHRNPSAEQILSHNEDQLSRDLNPNDSPIRLPHPSCLREEPSEITQPAISPNHESSSSHITRSRIRVETSVDRFTLEISLAHFVIAFVGAANLLPCLIVNLFLSKDVVRLSCTDIVSVMLTCSPLYSVIFIVKPFLLCCSSYTFAQLYASQFQTMKSNLCHALDNFSDILRSIFV